MKGRSAVVLPYQDGRSLFLWIVNPFKEFSGRDVEEPGKVIKEIKTDLLEPRAICTPSAR